MTTPPKTDVRKQRRLLYFGDETDTDCTDTLQLLCDTSPVCVAALDLKVSTSDGPTDVDCRVFAVVV